MQAEREDELDESENRNKGGDRQESHRMRVQRRTASYESRCEWVMRDITHRGENYNG